MDGLNNIKFRFWSKLTKALKTHSFTCVGAAENSQSGADSLPSSDSRWRALHFLLLKPRVRAETTGSGLGSPSWLWWRKSLTWELAGETLVSSSFLLKHAGAEWAWGFLRSDSGHGWLLGFCSPVPFCSELTCLAARMAKRKPLTVPSAGKNLMQSNQETDWAQRSRSRFWKKPIWRD